MTRLLYEVIGIYSEFSNCYNFKSKQLPDWKAEHQGNIIDDNFLETMILAHLYKLKREGKPIPESATYSKRSGSWIDAKGNVSKMIVVYFDIGENEQDTEDIDFLVSADADTLADVTEERMIQAQIANRRFAEARAMYSRKRNDWTGDQEVLKAAVLSERVQVAEAYALRQAEPEVTAACSLLSPTTANRVARYVYANYDYSKPLPQYTYPAVYEPPVSHMLYFVRFPDLPDCFTYGDNMCEARHAASVALSHHLRALWENGKMFPQPSKMPDVKSHIGKGYIAENVTVDIRDERDT